MKPSYIEQEAHFIGKLKSVTGKPLEAWFDMIDKSGYAQFLDIRKWLVEAHQIDTPTATTLARLFLEESKKNGPLVTFTQEGRSGSFSYSSGAGSFSSWWEFGGGDVIAILSIPNPAYWEKETGIPLAERTAILQYIGSEAIRQQNGGRGRYEVEEDCVLIKA